MDRAIRQLFEPQLDHDVDAEFRKAVESIG